MLKKWMKVWLVCLLVWNVMACPALAEEKDKIDVGVNSLRVLNYSGVKRVAVANPNIADVVVISDSEIMIVGKSTGRTDLHVWYSGYEADYCVDVSGNDAAVENDIKKALGSDNIQVTKVGKSIMLEGKVKDNYQKQRAEKIASAYGEKVVNLLELTQPLQVKIEAKIVEISKTNIDELGIKWGNDPKNPGTFRFGQSPMPDWKVKGPDGNEYNVYNNALLDSRPIGKAWGGLGGYWDINAQLSALVTSGKAKILSQPNMVTVSGEAANILVGGQIPIPVTLQNGMVSVDWKDYGIKLDIAPEVNSEGLINSKVKAEVSAVDWSSSHQIGLSANLKIPPITMRRAQSTIALSSGQTIAIGGLLSKSDSNSVYKIPLLGDLPILGALFTSKSYQKEETELIILITPTIVDPASYVPNTPIASEK